MAATTIHWYNGSILLIASTSWSYCCVLLYVVMTLPCLTNLAYLLVFYFITILRSFSVIIGFGCLYDVILLMSWLYLLRQLSEKAKYRSRLWFCALPNNMMPLLCSFIRHLLLPLAFFLFSFFSLFFLKVEYFVLSPLEWDLFSWPSVHPFHQYVHVIVCLDTV